MVGNDRQIGAVFKGKFARGRDVGVRLLFGCQYDRGCGSRRTSGTQGECLQSVSDGVTILCLVENFCHDTTEGDVDVLRCLGGDDRRLVIERIA